MIQSPVRLFIFTDLKYDLVVQPDRVAFLPPAAEFGVKAFPILARRLD